MTRTDQTTPDPPPAPDHTEPTITVDDDGRITVDGHGVGVMWGLATPDHVPLWPQEQRAAIAALRARLVAPSLPEGPRPSASQIAMAHHHKRGVWALTFNEAGDCCSVCLAQAKPAWSADSTVTHKAECWAPVVAAWMAHWAAALDTSQAPPEPGLYGHGWSKETADALTAAPPEPDDATYVAHRPAGALEAAYQAARAEPAPQPPADDLVERRQVARALAVVACCEECADDNVEGWMPFAAAALREVHP